MAGVLLAASLFAKRTAAPFIGIAALALFLADRRRGLILAVTTAVVTGITILLLQHATRGWFWRYVFGLHQRHDFDNWLGFGLAPLRVILLLGPALVLVPLALLRTRRDGPLLAVLGVFAAAMVATIRGAGPPWGYANAFIPAMFFGILLAMAAAPARRDGGHVCRSPRPLRRGGPGASCGRPTGCGRGRGSRFPSATTRGPSSPPPPTGGKAMRW